MSVLTLEHGLHHFHAARGKVRRSALLHGQIKCLIKFTADLHGGVGIGTVDANVRHLKTKKRLSGFLAMCGVVPVVVLDDAAQAVPTAKAMLAGGVDVMEMPKKADNTMVGARFCCFHSDGYMLTLGIQTRQLTTPGVL